MVSGCRSYHIHLKFISWSNSARCELLWIHIMLPIKQTLLLAWTAAFACLCSSSLGFEPLQDPSINLPTIAVGAGILQLWAWVTGVYRSWCLDALKGSFTVNLIMLGVDTYHVNHSGGNTSVGNTSVGNTSVSIALCNILWHPHLPHIPDTYQAVKVGA